MNFVHIPKTGGTSVIAALYGGDAVDHRRASQVPRPRFAFVRHPLDRLRSVKRGATTFAEFVRLPDDGLFLNTQSSWLDAEMDFIGRFERLREDFATISDKPLPHLRASARRPWPEYFDAETRGFALRRYHEDFVRFGYVA